MIKRQDPGKLSRVKNTRRIWQSETRLEWLTATTLQWERAIHRLNIVGRDKWKGACKSNWGGAVQLKSKTKTGREVSETRWQGKHFNKTWWHRMSSNDEKHNPERSAHYLCNSFRWGNYFSSAFISLHNTDFTVIRDWSSRQPGHGGWWFVNSFCSQTHNP